MRLLAPLLLAVIGALTGLAVHALLAAKSGRAIVPRGRTGARSASVRQAMLAGVLGGFLLLWLRDALDIELGSAIAGGLLTTVCGAALAALSVVWISRSR